MIKKILKIVGIVIVSIAIVAVLFIEFWPGLGGSVTDEDQKEYKARNSLYKKGIFHGNPEIQLMTGQKSEYKNEENKYGSICFLLLVIFTITISNIYVFLNI